MWHQTLDLQVLRISVSIKTKRIEPCKGRNLPGQAAHDITTCFLEWKKEKAMNHESKHAVRSLRKHIHSPALNPVLPVLFIGYEAAVGAFLLPMTPKMFPIFWITVL